MRVRLHFFFCSTIQQTPENWNQSHNPPRVKKTIFESQILHDILSSHHIRVPDSTNELLSHDHIFVINQWEICRFRSDRQHKRWIRTVRKKKREFENWPDDASELVLINEQKSSNFRERHGKIKTNLFPSRGYKVNWDQYLWR